MAYPALGSIDPVLSGRVMQSHDIEMYLSHKKDAGQIKIFLFVFVVTAYKFCTEFKILKKSILLFQRAWDYMESRGQSFDQKRLQGTGVAAFSGASR
ncbi:hypothetical protein [Desulfobotulus alkaliphilus]|uniref:hypothetical protein n=1 Tax=Desulfobotulus alkaliphilus TaxID=622671 RepID=UPI0011A1E2B0|nr:hypothetical protein [Desulfobotulus alkaliphilus]